MRLILNPINIFIKTKKKKIYLGDWCLNNINDANKKILSYHWRNPNKKLRDNKYLDSLLRRTHFSLKKNLNTLHKTNYSQKFWDILLFPWTSMFIPMVFDRWEILNRNFAKYNITEIPIFKFDKYVPPKTFDVFLNNLNNHLYNHMIFSDILIFKNEKKLKIYKLNNKEIFNNKKTFKPSFIKLLFDFVISKIKKNYYVFIYSYFSFFNFLKLNFYLKQPPRIFYEFYKDLDLPDLNKSIRKKLLISLKKNSFEKFLSICIVKNLPISFIEGFNKLIFLSKKIKIDPKLIITGNYFFPTELARFWAALKTENKIPLILNEHGGSIPFNSRSYSKINEIFDKKISWSIPMNKNEIQLSPSKLLGFKNLKSKKKDIHIITLEKTLYAFSSSAIQSSIILDDFAQKKIFLNELLKKNINIKIKPYHNLGWNLEKKYQRIVGKENIFKGDMKELFTNSKLNVCTYPETSFLESFLSGVPTILIYLKKYYDFNKKFISILKKLEQNRIIFSNPLLAADHVKNIYNNPSIWWNSKDLKNIRKEFSNNFGKVSENWITEWKNFIITSAK